MKKIIVVISILMFIGCAQTMLVKDGVTREDFERDKARCIYETSCATQSIDYSLHTIFGQELDRALRQKDLIIKCMQAKGYSIENTKR